MRRGSAARWSPRAAPCATSSSAPTATSSTSTVDEAPHDRYRHSVERAKRVRPPPRHPAVETLEQFLADRGSVTASARALYVHPNTVRQRLERIERVAELDLADEDLLSLELALKLARLHRVRAEAIRWSGGPMRSGRYGCA